MNTPRHFLTTRDFSPGELRDLLARALAFKRGERQRDLGRASVVLLFFNPSVRTRVSMAAATERLNGAPQVINVGSDTWVFEDRTGVVMDGATQEHVREAAPVLSRYACAIGIRHAALLTRDATTAAARGDAAAEPPTWKALKRDHFLRTFAEHATVPVINLESNVYHPCQGLGDALTLIELLGAGDPRADLSDKKFVLSWAYHPKALPLATPHSQLLAACALGLDVTLCAPEGWDLDAEVVAAAEERAIATGGQFRVSRALDAAADGAHVITAKSWASLKHFGSFAAERAARERLREAWTVDARHMERTAGGAGAFLHCLPIRRNVVATDAVLDGPWSRVVDQAENRLWAQAAVLDALIG